YSELSFFWLLRERQACRRVIASNKKIKLGRARMLGASSCCNDRCRQSAYGRCFRPDQRPKPGSSQAPSRTNHQKAVCLLSILSIFCLLSVPGTSRTAADTLARNANKIDTFRGPPASADVRTTNSHGENRGSSPLGSATRDFFSFASMCLPICPGEFATFLFSSCFAIAAAFSRSCSAARVYLSTSLSVLWPVTAMISCALHPASARRRAAAFRRPWALQYGRRPALRIASDMNC